LKPPTSGTGSANGPYYPRVRGIHPKGPSPWRSVPVQLGPLNNDQVTIYRSDAPSNTTMCANRSYTLIASGPSGTSFSNWAFSGNYTYGSGSASTASVTTSSTFNYLQVSVTATNSCGSTTVTRTFGNGCYSGLVANDVNIYPNPMETVSLELTVEWPDSAQVESVALIDRFARTLDSGQPKTNKIKFKMNKLPAGEYYIHLYVAGDIIRKRVLKK
jgi:hypothetical protein